MLAVGLVLWLFKAVFDRAGGLAIDVLQRRGEWAGNWLDRVRDLVVQGIGGY